MFCGIDQHFFQDYFTTVLRDVYRQFFDKYGDELIKENLKRAKEGLDPLMEISLDDRDEDHDPQETISKSSEDSNSGMKLDKDIHPNILYFAQHPIEVSAKINKTPKFNGLAKEEILQFSSSGFMDSLIIFMPMIESRAKAIQWS